MKLLDLYLEEIRHQLPPRNRRDVLEEIRSNLMDAIEDQNPNPGQEPDETTIKSVLRSFGSPREIAGQYGAQNYLIGPRFFPIYIRVLKIVLIVVAALNLLGLVIAIVNHSGVNPNMLDAILEIVGGLFSSLFTAFGIVTLSFASIERTTSKVVEVNIGQAWDPNQLLEQENKERISITGLAVEITLTLVFIAVINFFIDKIGIYYLDEAGWVSFPILSEAFHRYIPWITTYAVLDIALNLYLIRMGFWNKYAAVAKILINAFKIAVNAALISGPAIIAISSADWKTLDFDFGVTAEYVTRMANLGLDVVLGLAIFGLAVEIIKRIYETFIKGSPASILINPK